MSGAGALWGVVMTTSPSVSWGGEGEYGYHLVKLDSTTRTVVANIDLGKRHNRRVGEVRTGHGAVWLGLTPASLLKVDARTHAVAEIKLPRAGFWRGNERVPSVAVDDAGVWVLVWGRPELFHVDAASDQVTAVDLERSKGPSISVSARDGAVWVTHERGLSRVDAAARKAEAQSQVPVAR